MLPTFLYSENILLLYISNLLYKGIVFLPKIRKNMLCEKKLNYKAPNSNIRLII